MGSGLTNGGADVKTKVGASMLPAVYEGFRENVRQLLNSPDFRKLVTAPAGPSLSAIATPSTVVALQAGAGRLTAAQASSAVAVVFAAHVMALNEVAGEVAHVDWSTHGDA